MKIALIRGDGIGRDVAESAISVAGDACLKAGAPPLSCDEIEAGAAHFLRSGADIEPDGEERCRKADAIFLGAIGLPDVRREDGTEIAPHLRLRDRFGLYAGVRPVRAYPNAPRLLADPRAAGIDMVVLRESTEGLFYSAAVHGRGQVIDDSEARDILRITRATTEKLHHFGFELARRRKARGRPGKLACVDKANVFASMAFFRKIFDEIAPDYPDVETDRQYVDAQALNLVLRPWDSDVMVMENMFGDILSDLAGGLVGGMGMAACAEIGDETGLFQPAHGSAPDIAGRDLANPLAAILSSALMLDFLAGKSGESAYARAGRLVEDAVEAGFETRALRPAEFGGDMGTAAMTLAVREQVDRAPLRAA